MQKCALETLLAAGYEAGVTDAAKYQGVGLRSGVTLIT